MSNENKARKEIFETQILVDYLIEFGLNFDDIDNFTNKRVREALEWHLGRQEHEEESDSSH